MDHLLTSERIANEVEREIANKVERELKSPQQPRPELKNPPQPRPTTISDQMNALIEDMSLVEARAGRILHLVEELKKAIGG